MQLFLIANSFVHPVATVLTVYGIETGVTGRVIKPIGVATVLTVYGIETI